MTAKEYLKSISQLDDEIKRNRQRCRTLRGRCNEYIRKIFGRCRTANER